MGKVVVSAVLLGCHDLAYRYGLLVALDSVVLMTDHDFGPVELVKGRC